MVNPSRYQPKFFAAWEAFADKIQWIFNNGEQDAQTQPTRVTTGLSAPAAAVANPQPSAQGDTTPADSAVLKSAPPPEQTARLDQYVRAILAVADLLYVIGQRDVALRFHTLAEALHDVAEGRAPPLFRVKKKPGRQFDTSEFWRLRAYLCIGIQYLISSGMEQDEAITYVVRKYRRQFQKLLRSGSRPGSDLKIPAWLKEFATEAVHNDAALWTYKKEIQRLEEFKTRIDRPRLRQTGLDLIEKTAVRAAQVLKTQMPA
jgi:hypothetical protein